MKIVNMINATSTTNTKLVVIFTEIDDKTLWVKSVELIELFPVEVKTWVSGEAEIGDLLHISLSLKLSPKNWQKLSNAACLFSATLKNI